MIASGCLTLFNGCQPSYFRACYIKVLFANKTILFQISTRIDDTANEVAILVSGGDDLVITGL